MKKILVPLLLMLASPLFAGTVGTLPKFISSSKIADSYVSESTTTGKVTVAAQLESTGTFTAPAVVSDSFTSESTATFRGFGYGFVLDYWNGMLLDGGTALVIPPSSFLQVDDIRVSTPDAVFQFGRGTAALPSVVGYDDGTTGFAFPDANTIIASILGTGILSITGSGIASTTATLHNIRPPDGDGVVFGGGTYPNAVIGASWGWGLDAFGMSLGGSYFNSYGQLAFFTDGDNQAMWMGADVGGGRIELYDDTGSSVQTTFIGNFGVSISTHVVPLAADATRAVLFSSGAASAEMWVRDGAGNDTQISPHDPVTGKWRFLSCNDQLGRCYEVPDMEKLVAIVEKLSGVSLHREWEK